jgi:hypothetical protein
MKKSIQRQRHLAITTRRALAGTALGLLWLLSAPGLASAQFAITQLDVPGWVATYADGNSVHRVVGEFDDEDGTHGFVMNRGEFTQFDVPGAQGYTSINGINASGERAGIYFSGERYYGYFWSHGVVTPLDPPGSTFSLAATGLDDDRRLPRTLVTQHGVDGDQQLARDSCERGFLRLPATD